MNRTHEIPSDELPPAFVERLQVVVGSAWTLDIEQSFRLPKSVAFRVNRLLTTPALACPELCAAGLAIEPLPWLADGFFVSSDQRALLTRHALVENGHVYVHNPSSMLATLALAPQPGETVMDMAAAPGGKTLHIAAMMGGEGFLSAVEPVQSRFFKLKANLRRGGAAFVRTYQLDARRVPNKTGPRFDRILLDAPCSGEARFHVAEPDSYKNWSLRKIRECHSKQRGLIRAGFAALKPGGRMLYCTCSYAPEENEAVVDELLRTESESALNEIHLPVERWQPGLPEWQGHRFSDSMSRCRRILPDHLYDGMFMAMIQKLTDDGLGKPRSFE
ncbi:MAG: RsmB/NOP family class I SAM-dependent RNA methyltransferase [Planctomycetaceae bacterium]|nr:RsmB/NOP family class I SAM-dependent RNA methyltransferase [Planctomycetaceae bacterium]